MYSVIIAVLSLFYGSTFCETADKQALMRDLIIILDETEATNPEKNWAAINMLHNALLAEAAPILINESAWQTFIKARQEWLLQSQIPGTSEYKIVALKKQILERANYWYTMLATESDDTHVRALMADKVNEEFYVKENYAKLQESGVIPKDMLSDTMSKTRRCVSLPVVFDAWYWFYLDTGYYLALPKSYCEKCTNFSSVLMRIVKNEQIELILTVPNGDVFYATMRSIDGKPMFRNLQKLSSKAVDSYRAYYEKTKTELITQYDQSTVTLRNHYLQAMATAKAQAPAAQAQSTPSAMVSSAA